MVFGRALNNLMCMRVQASECVVAWIVEWWLLGDYTALCVCVWVLPGPRMMGLYSRVSVCIATKMTVRRVSWPGVYASASAESR